MGAEVMRNSTPQRHLPEGVSVVVPVYNGADTLPDLITALEPVLRSVAPAFEVVLVNDCSPDESWKVITELARKYPWVRGINLMRNFGQQNTTLCGLRAARYDTIVTMDDDLQNPPDQIPILLDKLREGFDVVYGPPLHEQHGLFRDAASSITKMALANAMGADVARSVNSFRAFRTHLRDALSDYRSPHVSIDVLLTWTTTRYGVVRVRHDTRPAGRSGYNLRKLIRHALNLITGFSAAPLQLASVVGFLSMLFGLAILVFVMVRFVLVGRDVPGFTMLASTIAIFSGVQLFMLGVFGEYLARIHFRMLERPTYAVRETTDEPEENAC